MGLFGLAGVPLLTFALGAFILGGALVFFRVGILGAGFAGVAAGAKGEAAPPLVAVTVQPGDRLWTIARRLYGPEADLRRVIEIIRGINGDDCVRLVPGRTIRLPMPAMPAKRPDRNPGRS